LISKPKMTEKYLKKPPFRFLHDICMETMKATGFGQGLYTEAECDAAGLADKQAKVDFLNKIVSVVSFALDEPINVAANKIVAGLDADKTNGFLVKLHQAATTTVGPKAETAVQRVLAGETVSVAKKKEKKEKKEEAPPADAGAAPSGDGGDAAAAEAAAEEEKKKKAAEKKRREEKKKKEAEAAAAAEAAAGAEAAAAAEQAAAEEAAAEEKRRQKEEAKRQKEEKKRQQEEEAANAAAAAAAAEEERRRQEESAALQAAAQQADDGQEMMMGQADGELAGVKKAERPRTAGRKPPKVASKVQTKQDEPGLSQGVAPPALIADGVKEDDDDDMFEAAPQGKVIAVNAGDGEAHGKLVRDILAEKKEKEKEEARRKEQAKEEEAADDGAGGIKMGRLKRKKDNSQAMGQVDIDKLTESIQELCQAVNPLGKSIDLVYQDIANMGKELDHWKQENRDAAELYQRELKNTEDTLVPLYRKIQELDDKIGDQKQALGNARSRIAKNDVYIQNLLEAVVVTK